MYSKKYRIAKIVEFGRHNPVYDEIEIGDVCYLAYLKPGERGWFLYETEPGVWVHRVHTSIIQNVKYGYTEVIVETEHTRFVFEVMEG